jgi:hypothetical protein
MTQDHLRLLAFGIAVALAIPVEIWIRRRRRRRDPWRRMDRFTDLEGKEWYYLKPTRDDPAGQ